MFLFQPNSKNIQKKAKRKELKVKLTNHQSFHSTRTNDYQNLSHVSDLSDLELLHQRFHVHYLGVFPNYMGVFSKRVGDFIIITRRKTPDKSEISQLKTLRYSYISHLGNEKLPQSFAIRLQQEEIFTHILQIHLFCVLNYNDRKVKFS